MKMRMLALMLVVACPLPAWAVAPVRNGVVIIDATELLRTLPEGNNATNGPFGGRGGGGGRGRGRGAASAPAAAPAPVDMLQQPAVPPFTFQNFSVNLRVATPFSAKANIPQAGTWHLHVRSRSTVAGNSFKVSVNDKPSAQTFGNHAINQSLLQTGGSFELPQGTVNVAITDITPGNSIDVILLSPNPNLTDDDLRPLQYPQDLVLLKEYQFPVQIDGTKFGDLNGDGKTDIVVLTPNYSTYAFDHDGRELWHWDAPQGGTQQRSEFEAPGNVWDFDQDGKAEVIAWRQIDEKEYLVMLDGITGAIKHQADWPTRPLPHVYNNFRTAIAKLRPGYPDCVLVYSDYGGEVELNAYGPKLEMLWSYKQPRAKDYFGHYIYPFDITGDGIDEVFISHVMLDAQGKELWNNYEQFPINNDHVDSARILDLDGDGKFEIVAGQSDVGSTAYDAHTGKLLWQRFANHTQKVEAGPYREGHAGNVVVGSSRIYLGGLSGLLRWYDIHGNRIDNWPPFVSVPGNPNFVKGDFKGDGRPTIFWQRFRIEPDGTGTLAFPEEVFHAFDFLGMGYDQIITQSARGSTVKIYGYKGVQPRPISPQRMDPVYRAHSISNHTHY